MHDQKVSRESHNWVQDRLSEYMDDRLSPLERVQVERHLQTCQQCQQDLASLRWTVSLMRAAPKPRLPRQFTIPVAPVPARRPAYGLSALRLATALATLILISLVGIDVIMQVGGGTASAPAAPLSSAQLAAPTRAALAIATPSELNRDAAAGAAQPAIQPTATHAPVPATVALKATNAPRSAASSSSSAPSAPFVAATAAPPAPALSATPSASKAFSGPAAGTRSEPPTPTASATPSPTPMLLGLGAGPVATPPANKSSDNTENTSVPPDISATGLADPTPEPPMVPPSPLQSLPEPTATVSVQAYAQPTLVVPPAATTAPVLATAGITPLRVAELGALFVAVFLGALLLLLGLRR